MSELVSLRLDDAQATRLKRAARGLGRTPSETAAFLLDENLRLSDFDFLEFRDTTAGRQTYLKGRRLQVWFIASVARQMDGDATRVAQPYELPEAMVSAALKYAAAFPEEIEAAVADNDKSPEELQRLLPTLKVLNLSMDAPAP